MMASMNFTKRTAMLGALLASAFSTSACVSIGAGVEPPANLLTLTSSAAAPAGTTATAGEEASEGAIAVLTPETPAKLDLARVPVNVSPTQVAYLQEAVWIEKPARLFRRLMGETLRAKGAALVLDSDDTPTRASRFVRGTLSELSYDATSNSVLIRFDAIVSDEDGKVTSRRFEAREQGVVAEAEFVGPALNRVANTVAQDVADWVLETP